MKPNHEAIYLVPTDYDGGQLTYSWCDCPAPGEGMREEDATRYVREDIYLALQAQVEHLRVAGNALRKPWDLSKILGSETRRLVQQWDVVAAATPAQCLAEHDAVVGRKAFIAGVNATGQGYNGEIGLSDDEIIDLAELYVSRKIRQHTKAGAA